MLEGDDPRAGHLAFRQRMCPQSEEFAHFIKKNAYSRGLARWGEGGWVLLELTEHVERNKDGFFRFSAAKCALKVQSMVARDAFEVEFSLITRKFQVCNEFSAFQKNYVQKLEYMDHVYY